MVPPLNYKDLFKISSSKILIKSTTKDNDTQHTSHRLPEDISWDHVLDGIWWYTLTIKRIMLSESISPTKNLEGRKSLNKSLDINNDIKAHGNLNG